MFPLTITLKNYRCFKASNPARIEVRPGFTAFVGPNNAGKSTLLRFFYELRPTLELLTNATNIVHLISSPYGIQFLGTEDPTEVFFSRETESRELTIDLDLSVASNDHLSGVRLLFERNQPAVAKAIFYLGQQHEQITGVKATSGDIFTAQLGGKEQTVNISLFVEIMRALSKSIYIAAFRNAIHEGSSTLYDLSIGTAFITQWDSWKTGAVRTPQQRIQTINDELAQIFGFTHLEISKSQDGKTLQIVADKNPQRLRELGAGFSQFLIVLAQTAIRRPPFLLIDEPELNLHPALQVQFLTALANYTQYGVIFSTHSMGLARSVAEHIYTVRKPDAEALVKPYAATESFAEFLGEMSFSTFKDVGYEIVLGVEGPSEIPTLQEFLRKLNKEHRIALIQLGGRSMICKGRQQELAELKRFSKENKIAMLIDSERDQEHGPIPQGRQDFVNDCEALGYKVHVTAKRAMENYFPEHAIQSIFGQKYRALQPYELLEKVTNGWNKTSHNWRIAKEMSREELLATDFGKFLESL